MQTASLRTATRRAPPQTSIVIAAMIAGAGAGIAIAFGAVSVGIGISLLPLAALIMRYPWVAVLIWLSLLPLLLETTDASAGPGIWFLHRLLIPGAVLVTFIYILLDFRTSQFRLSLTDAAALVFLLFGLANVLLLSNNPTRMSVAFADSFLVPMCMYWLVRLIDPSEEDVRRLIPILVWLLLLQFTVGFLSWIAPTVLPPAWLGRAGERTVGTLGGPGPYSVTLVFCSALIVRRLGMMRTGQARWWLLAVVAAGVYGVVLSFSRGSWLGALPLVLGVLILHRRIGAQLFGLSVVLALVLAVGPLANQFDFAAERLGDEETAASRLVTNNAAIRMIETSPLIGFGYGNFEKFDEQFKVRVGDIPIEPGSAHHTYLALAAENGIPALIIYFLPAAWLFVLTVRRWGRLPREGFMNRQLMVLLWLAVADQLIVSNFMDMLHSSVWGATVWWLSLGLIHVIITRASVPRVNGPERSLVTVSPLRGAHEST
jgi:O-antigen ligase